MRESFTPFAFYKLNFGKGPLSRTFGLFLFARQTRFRWHASVLFWIRQMRVHSPLANASPVLVSILMATALVTMVALGGCVTVRNPVEEYNLARAAFEGARNAEAARFAPALWYKAESAYREAQRRYKDTDYPRARELFIEAKYFAEKAETAAEIARFSSGDGAPR